MQLVAVLGAALALSTAGTQDAPSTPPASPPVAESAADAPVRLSPTQLFAFADAARDAGDFTTAETAYRALAGDPDIELRSEARFRLALMLADRMGRVRDAAVELRRILDDRPDAARVRLELARMDAMLGRIGGADPPTGQAHPAARRSRDLAAG